MTEYVAPGAELIVMVEGIETTELSAVRSVTEAVESASFRV